MVAPGNKRSRHRRLHWTRWAGAQRPRRAALGPAPAALAASASEQAGGGEGETRCTASIQHAFLFMPSTWRACAFLSYFLSPL